MPPCLIRKSDGATIYATRDLTATLYRQNTYGFDKAPYICWSRTKLTFQSIFHRIKNLAILGVGMEHVPFGFI